MFTNNAYVNSVCGVTVNILMRVGLWNKQLSCFLCSLAEISLDVDADRDGVIEKNNPNKVSFVCSFSWDLFYIIDTGEICF